MHFFIFKGGCAATEDWTKGERWGVGRECNSGECCSPALLGGAASNAKRMGKPFCKFVQKILIAGPSSTQHGYILIAMIKISFRYGITFEVWTSWYLVLVGGGGLWVVAGEWFRIEIETPKLKFRLGCEIRLNRTWMRMSSSALIRETLKQRGMWLGSTTRSMNFFHTS